MPKSGHHFLLLFSSVMLLSCQVFTKENVSSTQVVNQIELGQCEKNLSPMPYPEDFQCGYYEVFENRTKKTGRKIPLFVVVAPAKNPEGASQAPLFFLNGGPGEANSPMAPFIASMLGSINQTRDLIFADLRGTGKSNPLKCERIGAKKSLQRHMSYLLRVDVDVEPCIRKLKKVADLTQYNTTYAAADYNDIRAALGYDKMALFGGSYGTRLALDIVRRYPQHVEGAIIFGVAAPSMHIPSGFARSFQNVLDEMFERCEKTSSCKQKYPKLHSDFEKVLSVARKDGISARVAHPEYGDTRNVSLSYGEFAMGLRFMAYDAAGIAELPGLITAAAEGNYNPIVQLIARIYYGVHQRFFSGLNYSFVCTEDLPFVDLEAEKESAAGTVLGMYRMQQQLDTCAKWPSDKTILPADFHTPVVSEVPVLLMTGANDPVTPPSNADEVSRTLSNSLHAVFAYRGHQIMEDPASTECFTGIMASFLKTATLDGLDTSCARSLKPIPVQALPTAAQ